MDENLRIHALVGIMPMMFNGNWGKVNSRVGFFSCNYWEIGYLAYDMAGFSEITSILTNLNKGPFYERRV